MPASPILYSFRRCPYAMRARMSLVYSQQTVELREVVLKSKPADLLAISPKGTVPVLLCEDGRVIDESLEIMHWALDRADPDAWLKDKAEQMVLIKHNDEQFKPLLDRYKYADRFPKFSEQYHREQCLGFLSTLDEQLKNHTFLFGDQIRLADIAIFPFIRQFAHVDLTWFEASQWQALKRWLNYFKASDLFTRSMSKYPAWKNGDLPLQFPPAGAYEV
jgi:glutathione S-transferase